MLSFWSRRQKIYIFQIWGLMLDPSYKVIQARDAMCRDKMEIHA